MDSRIPSFVWMDIFSLLLLCSFLLLRRRRRRRLIADAEVFCWRLRIYFLNATRQQWFLCSLRCWYLRFGRRQAVQVAQSAVRWSCCSCCNCEIVPHISRRGELTWKRGRASRGVRNFLRDLVRAMEVWRMLLIQVRLLVITSFEKSRWLSRNSSTSCRTCASGKSNYRTQTSLKHLLFLGQSNLQRTSVDGLDYWTSLATTVAVLDHQRTCNWVNARLLV